MRLLILFISCLSFSNLLFSQKQLILFKNGHVQASFKEGEYIRFVLRKNHRHAEGHIVELSDFSMITSNDTVQFKDILKINIKKHRGPAQWGNGIGGLMFVGGLLYLTIDQLNVLINVNAQDDKPAQWLVPLTISTVGGAMVFIRPKYKRMNGIRYLQTVDYTSPFYQR